MNKKLILASAAVLAVTAGLVRAASQTPVAATPKGVTSSAAVPPSAPTGMIAKGDPAGQEGAEGVEAPGQEQAEPVGQDNDNAQDGDQSSPEDGAAEAPETAGK